MGRSVYFMGIILNVEIVPQIDSNINSNNVKDPSFIYLATILPPILIGIIIWKSDKFPEPGKFLVASFLLGVSIYLPLNLFIMITEDHIAPLLGLA